MSEWISVEERLPDLDVQVLILTDSSFGYYNVSLGYYENFPDGKEEKKWIDREYGPVNATHWFPLPIFPDIKHE